MWFRCKGGTCTHPCYQIMVGVGPLHTALTNCCLLDPNGSCRSPEWREATDAEIKEVLVSELKSHGIPLEYSQKVSFN